MSRIRKFGILFAFACAVSGQSRSAESGELDSLRGRVIYLDFWASWCEPCRHSFPWMQRMQQSYEARGLTIIAVNLDRDRADAESFLKRFKPNFQIRFDPAGQWAERFQVRGMPTSILIDRHGVARFTHIGFRVDDGPEYARQIEDLLAEQ
jgi:cytochrome c biogenesis protein CcmG, thiol:disulfide interchange protein DsbE